MTLTCGVSGKRLFKEGHARSEADRISFVIGQHLFTYRCPFCGYWHLTKIRQGEEKRESNHSRGRHQGL